MLGSSRVPSALMGATKSSVSSLHRHSSLTCQGRGEPRVTWLATLSACMRAATRPCRDPPCYTSTEHTAMAGDWPRLPARLMCRLQPVSCAGPSPGHVGVAPRHKGQLGAVRAEPGRRIEVVPLGQHCAFSCSQVCATRHTSAAAHRCVSPTAGACKGCQAHLPDCHEGLPAGAAAGWRRPPARWQLLRLHSRPWPQHAAVSPGAPRAAMVLTASPLPEWSSLTASRRFLGSSTTPSA